MLSISRRIIASTRRVVSGINNNNNAFKSHLLSRSSISADFSNVASGTSSSYHTSSVSSSNRNFWNLPSSSRHFSLPHQQKRMFSVSTEILETLGDSITSAVLVSWSKEAGDTVREDDVIAIVETDKGKVKCWTLSSDSRTKFLSFLSYIFRIILISLFFTFFLPRIFLVTMDIKSKKDGVFLEGAYEEVILLFVLSIHSFSIFLHCLSSNSNFN